MRLILSVLLCYSFAIVTSQSQVIKGERAQYVTSYKLHDIVVEFSTPCIYTGEGKGLHEGKAVYIVRFEEYGIKRHADKLWVNNRVYSGVSPGAKVKPAKDCIWVDGKKKVGSVSNVRKSKRPRELSCAGVKVRFMEDADSSSASFFNANNAIFSNGLLVVKIWGGRLIVWGEDHGALKKGDVYEVSSSQVIKK
jgi:hypothetical protein